MLNIGSENYLARKDIVGIFPAEILNSKDSKSCISQMKEAGLYKASCPEEKIRSFVFYIDENKKLSVLASSLTAKTLGSRFNNDWGL